MTIFSTQNTFVDTAHVRPLFYRLSKDGHNEENVLHALGFKRYGDSYECLPDHISVKEFVNAVTQAQLLSGDALFCLHAGLEQSVSDFALMPQLMFYSRDLNQVIELYCQYLPAFNPAFPTTIQRFDDHVELPVQNPLFSDQEAAAAMEFRMAACARFMRVVTFNLNKDPITEIGFAHSPQLPISRYEKLLGTKVRFNQPHCYFSLSNESLSFRIPSHNQKMLNKIIAEAETLRLTQGCANGNTTTKVRALIRSGLSQGQATLTQVADSLSMSISTLKRHLDGENTSFQKLLDSERTYEIEHLLLNSNLNIEEVARRTGFSSSSSLGQTCRRVLGRSPLEIRKQKGMAEIL